MNSFAELTEIEIAEIKTYFRKVELTSFNDEEQEKIENVYRKVNKDCVDWARLFIYSYDTLFNIKQFKEILKNYSNVYKILLKNLQQYDRDVEYGKHIFYNRIHESSNKNINEIMELVNFAFSKILYEGEISEIDTTIDKEEII